MSAPPDYAAVVAAIRAALAEHDPGAHMQGAALDALGAHYGVATDAEARAAMLRQSQAEEVELAEVPLVSRCDAGVWVSGWLWAPHDEIEAVQAQQDDGA